MSQAKGKLLLGRTLTMALICAAILWVPAGRAEAAPAMGPYLDLSSGDGTFEWDSEWYDFDVDSSSAAIGFALDSAPTGPANFNYRLNIGIERQDLEDEFGDTLEMGGFVVESVFGFPLVRQPDFRWWAGPLVRIGFYSGETDDYYTSFGNRDRNIVYRARTEADLFELGVGVATGINVRIGPHTYLAPSAGVRFIGAAGEGTVKNLDQRTEFEDDLSGGMTTLFVNFSLLFD